MTRLDETTNCPLTPSGKALADLDAMTADRDRWRRRAKAMHRQIQKVREWERSPFKGQTCDTPAGLRTAREAAITRAEKAEAEREDLRCQRAECAEALTYWRDWHAPVSFWDKYGPAADATEEMAVAETDRLLEEVRK